MIGLEGSGFTICLGVILLLTGIVMYYCKSKITACENRMNTMLNLISDLHSEVNTLKQGLNVAQPVAPMQESEYTTTTGFTDENQSESESESESEEDHSDNEEEITIEKVVNPFETHPYKELIPSNSTVSGDLINESSESEGDTDDDTPKQEVKVVDLGPIEELEIGDLDEEEDEEDEEETSEEEGQIDYAKMQVTALKKLAAERQLVPNVHKLRKKELVNLLQSH